jgi:hypothetical protein
MDLLAKLSERLFKEISPYPYGTKYIGKRRKMKDGFERLDAFFERGIWKQPSQCVVGSHKNLALGR